MKAIGRQDRQLNTYDWLADVPGNAESTDLVEVHPEKLPDAISIRWDDLDKLETSDTRLTAQRTVRIIRELSRTGNSDTLREMIEAAIPLMMDLVDIDEEKIRYVIKDCGYNPNEYDTEEFTENLRKDTPCNSFVTSVFDKERFIYFMRYGIMFLNGKVPEKHIMRYPQFL